MCHELFFLFLLGLDAQYYSIHSSCIHMNLMGGLVYVSPRVDYGLVHAHTSEINEKERSTYNIVVYTFIYNIPNK